MLKKLLLGCALYAFLSAFGASIAAEIPQGKWWHFERISKRLNLSEEEKQLLDERYTESTRSLIERKSAVELEQFGLENLMESDPLNEGAVLEQFARLESARAALSRERFKFLLEVRKVLGIDRFQTLKLLYREFRQHRQLPRKGRFAPNR